MATLTPQEMDQAAELFEKELQAMPQTITIPFARMWKAHFMKAGHKRLGRIMVAHAKATDKMKDKDFTTPEDMKVLNEPVEHTKKFSKRYQSKEKEKIVTGTVKKADKPLKKKVAKPDKPIRVKVNKEGRIEKVTKKGKK
jgi:hypothetical protein